MTFFMGLSRSFLLIPPFTVSFVCHRVDVVIYCPEKKPPKGEQRLPYGYRSNHAITPNRMNRVKKRSASNG